MEVDLPFIDTKTKIAFGSDKCGLRIGIKLMARHRQRTVGMFYEVKDILS